MINNQNRPSGLAFSVPASNVQLTSRPKRGDIVSFSYESYSRYAVPLHVTVFRIRQDLSWGDVIRNYLADLPKDRAFSGIPSSPSLFPSFLHSIFHSLFRSPLLCLLSFFFSPSLLPSFSFLS